MRSTALYGLSGVFLLLIVTFQRSEAIRCYQCDRCSSTNMEESPSTNCKACLTRVQMVDGYLDRVDKRCSHADTCEEHKHSSGQTSYETTCCYDNLCNAAVGSLRGSSIWLCLLITSVLTALGVSAS